MSSPIFVAALRRLWLLVGILLLASPVQAQTDSAETDNQETVVSGAYDNLTEHQAGWYLLQRTGERVTATFATIRSPVQHWARQDPQPLFFVPFGYRPPVPVLRDVEGQPVQADGSPDPAHPNLRLFRLRVDPDGAVRYMDDAGVDEVGYLAYTLNTGWGTTSAANDQVFRALPAEPWSGSGFAELPVVPYVKHVDRTASAPVAASLTLQLEEAIDQEPIHIHPPADFERLSEEQAANLLARVPQLAGRASPTPLILPLARLNPPPVGGMEERDFPPLADHAPTPPPDRELAVVRFFPSGPVDWVPRINIVFSKPMVSLSSHAALADRVPAVDLAPRIAGEWQWLGTQSLVFQPTKPSTGSTRYEVAIHPGLEALDGSILEGGFAGSFETPRLQLLRVWPPESMRLPLQPHLVLVFNQAIEPRELIASLLLESAASIADVEVVQLDDADLPQGAREFLTGTMPERALVLRPSTPLARDARIVLAVEQGAPSAEGPLRTLDVQRREWKTIGPLQVRSAGCPHSWQRCHPNEDFHVGFTNALDTESLTTGMVSIRPPLPDGKVHVTPNGIRVTGSTIPDTIYTLRMAPGLTDVYGQPLSTVQEWMFHVIEPEPDAGQLHLPRSMEVLHPDDGGKYSLFTRDLDELRVLLFQVETSDFSPWGNWSTYWPLHLSRAQPVLWGRKPVFDKLLAIENGPASEIDETVLDLNPFLEEGRGHLVLVVVLPKEVQHKIRCGIYDRETTDEVAAVGTWLQVTDLNLDLFTDGRSALTRGSELTAGLPLPNVEMEMQFPKLDSHARAATDSTGYAQFDLSAFTWRYWHLLTVGRQGRDAALLPIEVRPRMHVAHRWHVFSDRYLYQPGEEVHIKGWVRQVGFSPDGDVSWANPDLRLMFHRVTGARGVLLDEGMTELQPHGALDLRFRVPTDANSGLGEVRFLLNDCDECAQRNDYFRQDAHRRWTGSEYSDDQVETVHFRIEEFRKPEVDLSLLVDEGHHLLRNPVRLTTRAQYFGGGDLAGASVTWKASGRPARYTPPGWHRFAFGNVVPWWMKAASVHAEVPTRTLSAETDAQGRHRLLLTTDSEQQMPVAHVLQVEATVQAPSQQTLTATESVLVHPALWYVGGRTDSYVGNTNEPFELDLVVTDLDGNPVAGQDILVATQPVSASDPSAGPAMDYPGCLVRSASVPVTCTLVFPESGSWRLDLSVQDAAGRVNTTRLVRWMTETGHPALSKVISAKSKETSAQVALIPDKDTYQPGDIAEILIQSPIVPAHGTVILNRSGIVSHRPVEIREASQVLEVPVKEAHVPNLHVSVFVRGALSPVDPDSPGKPVQAQGHINLPIPPDVRELGLDLQLATKDVTPGGEVSVSVRITDPAGQPVSGAEVALLAVDEAVLALSGHEFHNPLESFYPFRSRDLHHVSLVQFLQSKEFSMPVYQCIGGGGGDGAEPLKELFPIRSDFSPLAYFEPSGTTDQDGFFHAAWHVPDTVGRYRVVAMATTGARYFGLAESSYTVRLPIQLRPQWPRFLNFGDEADFSILVENQTDEAQDLTLIAQSDGLDLAYRTDGRAYDALAFNLPAQSRRQILLPARARESGSSQMLVTVFNEQFNDTVQGSLPVYQPAAQEGFATYGSVDEESILQGLALPDNVHRAFGRITISTSSTLLQSLSDGYRALGEFDPKYADPKKFANPELRASRLLANIALRDVLYAFALPDLPNPEVLDQVIGSDIAGLQKFQNPAGGFPTWRLNGPTWPFGSVHAMHALAVARAAGYPVAEETVQRGHRYLQEIEQHYPHHYSESVRRYITAYALFVRSLLEDTDTATAVRLLEQLVPQTHELEVIAWSLMVLNAEDSVRDKVDEWYRYIRNRADETTGKAEFARQARLEDGHLILHSSQRTDALLLRALMEIQPESDLIPKVVRSLLATRGPYGHWGSSQNNVFVLQAMNQYFRAYEATVPEFTARVWLDDTLVLNAPFKGRATASQQVSLPMDWLYAKEPSRIQVQRAGHGRLYYRLGFDYVPIDLHVEPRERGFSVVRSYAGVDDPEDVWKDDDGHWHVKLGARVRIDVTLVAPGARHHVMLANPLPGGLELLNPTLKSTEPFTDPSARGRYYWRWFDHQQLLDERAQTVTAWLPGGVYEYGVVARATTPGTFHVPPARAAEIYAPETFGNGSSDILIVEPR